MKVAFERPDQRPQKVLIDASTVHRHSKRPRATRPEVKSCKTAQHFAVPRRLHYNRLSASLTRPNRHPWPRLPRRGYDHGAFLMREFAAVLPRSVNRKRMVSLRT